MRSAMRPLLPLWYQEKRNWKRCEQSLSSVRVFQIKLRKRTPVLSCTFLFYVKQDNLAWAWTSVSERNEACEGRICAKHRIFSASIIDAAVTLHPITESSTWLDSFICCRINLCLTFITGKRLKPIIWNDERNSQVQ